MLQPSEREAALDELCGDGVAFHGWDESVELDWHLNEDVVRFIHSIVGDGAHTLETGCGYSTVAFALAGARHTVISPFPVEHDRIRDWCTTRGISLDRVDFIAAESQTVLPGLGSGPLDLVLVDGDHAFPVPFIDWFYAAERLRAGGLCIVDDTQLRTGAILHDFLVRETGRWRVHARFPTTVVFEKLTPMVLDPGGWMTQPYCEQVVGLNLRSVPLLVAEVRRLGLFGGVRNAVRLRTRLRRFLAARRHRSR
jgi:hypothetical protein